jgi:uncharacterized protein YpmB
MKNLKVTGLLMILIILIAISGITFVCVSMNQLSSQVQASFDMSIKKANAIESSYDMIYLYYRYYQIRNYP